MRVGPTTRPRRAQKSHNDLTIYITALTKPYILLTRITNFMSQLVVKKGPVGPNWAAGVGVLREVPVLAKNSSTDMKSD